MWKEIGIKFPWLKCRLVDRNRFLTIRGIKLWKLLTGLVDTPIPRHTFLYTLSFDLWVPTHWISHGFRFCLSFLLIQKNRKHNIYRSVLPTIRNFWNFFLGMRKKEESLDWYLPIDRYDGKDENIKDLKCFWSEITAYNFHK